MPKSRPKWFQPDIFSPPSVNNADFTVFSQNFPPKENQNPPPAVSNTSAAQDISLKEALWQEIHQFKAEKLYAEALSCFHTLFEKKYADNYTFYELADIYFLMNDYTRSLNWLQKFQTAEPENGKGFLLQARIFLQLGKKDDALSVVSQLFSRKIKIDEEEDLQKLDRLISRLKKIFKADKLLRRCPDINTYEKQRRHSLKNNSAVKTVPAASDDTAGTIIERTTMPTSNSPVNPHLCAALNRIWDMQAANQEDTKNILNYSAEDIGNAVMQQVLSYKKKIWLFNYLADVFRSRNNLKTALYLLRQALLLDDENEIVLKNLGYLLYKNGEYKAASAVLEDITVKDFAVSDLIRQCRNLESE